MSKGQIDQETLLEAMEVYFNNIFITWKSTNFYEFVASNSETSIRLYISKLVKPYVPEPFCCEKSIPRQIWPS